MTVQLLRSFALLLPLIAAANLAGIQKPEERPGEPIADARGHGFASAWAKNEIIARDCLERLHDGQHAEQHDRAAKLPEKAMKLAQGWPPQTDSFTELARKSLSK